MKATLEISQKMAEDGHMEDAIRVGNDCLDANPDDPRTLFHVGHLFILVEKWGLAYNIYKRAIELAPNVPGLWNNLGRCLQELNRISEAEAAMRKGLELKPDDWSLHNNMLLMAANQARPVEAKVWYEKALALSTDDEQRRKLNENIALANLLLGEYDPGWERYECGLGHNKYRKERIYKKEPRWDGTKGQNVIAFGEQGIGDEVLFASCIPELLADCKQVTIECDHRLENMFRRSFPGLLIHGTRYADGLLWPDQLEIDARVAFGSLPKFYRRSVTDYPGTPYIKTDPERRLQWRALLDSLPGRKIGLSWTAGRPNTRTKERSVTPELLLPILQIPNCTFISLEYQAPGDLSEYGIHHWPRATQTQDYEDTAALIAELDEIVGVTTSNMLLAGAIGKRAHILVPPHPTWHWQMRGSMPWFPETLKLYRKSGKSWDPVVREIARAIQ